MQLCKTASAVRKFAPLNQLANAFPHLVHDKRVRPIIDTLVNFFAVLVHSLLIPFRYGMSNHDSAGPETICVIRISATERSELLGVSHC
jgi:hypothetical protein